MFNQSTIIDNFQKMVGIRSFDANFPTIDTDLQDSTYGDYIEDLHPLFTHENFFNAISEFDDYDGRVLSVLSYSSLITYKKNEIVSSGGELYRSLVNSNIGNLVTDATKWVKTNFYSHFFRKRLNTAYFQAVQLMIDRKIGATGGARNVLNNLQLYKKKGSNNDAITKLGRFCGFRLSVFSPSVNIILHKIALQLTQTQNNLKIYVYNADKRQPVQTFTLNQSVAYDMFEHELNDLVLDWTMGTGDFIIGYYEDELTGQAIRNNIDFQSMKGGCCNVDSVLVWEQYKTYLGVKPFYVDSDKINLTSHELIWDIEDEMYVSENTFGINLWLSANCEITDYIVRQKHIFRNAVKQILVNLLIKDLVYSTRNTVPASNIRGLAQMEGIDKFILKHEQKVNEEISRLSFDATGISSPCLPNHDRNKKPKFKAII